MTAKLLGSLTLATGLLLLVQCGGSSQTPLSAEQKGKVKTVFTSLGDISQAPVEAKQRSGGGTSSTNALQALGLSLRAAADDQSYKSRSLMADRLTPSACKIDYEAQKGGLESGLSGSTRVSGEKCPISLDLSYSGTVIQSEDKDKAVGAIKFHLAYSVKDPEFKKLTDVDASEIHASLEAKGESGTFSANGSIHSQSLGDIKINGSGGGSSGKVSLQLTFTFPDFVATFQMEGQQGDKVRLTLNGEELDEAKLREIGFESISKTVKN
ncbi:MAG: hypothetical protein HY537_18185 [Deltaproteobacteria bacterium]|nr:hypothetical protein [Deltaproteobacteria bacterium]